MQPHPACTCYYFGRGQFTQGWKNVLVKKTSLGLTEEELDSLIDQIVIVASFRFFPVCSRLSSVSKLCSVSVQLGELLYIFQPAEIFIILILSNGSTKQQSLTSLTHFDSF